MAPFQGFGFVHPFDDGCVQAGEDVADFGGAGAEEFAAHVDQVEPPVRELVVQVVLQPHGVVAEDHGVHVVVERHGGIAEFADPVHGFEPVGHADLDDVLAERADVGDDIDVPGPDVGGAAGDAIQGVPDLSQLDLGLAGAGVISPARAAR